MRINELDDRKEAGSIPSRMSYAPGLPRGGLRRMSEEYHTEKHTTAHIQQHWGRGLMWFALLLFLLTIGLPSTVLADQFKIQRGSTVVADGFYTATATAPADFEAVSSLSRAFIRVISTQAGGTGDGPASPPSTTIPPDQLTATVEFTDTSTITFTRSTTTGDCRLSWEIWEYTGPDSGANEFIVRGQGVSESITGTYDDEAVSGVTDQNHCVVFLTGVQNSSPSADDYLAHTFHAYLLDASTVRIERAVAGASVKGSYAVVEFTGTNWDVQTGTHTFTAAGAVETETISALAGTDKAFLITQHMTAQNGLDEYGYQAAITATDEVSFRLRSTASSPSNHTVRYWVVENSDSGFLVRRGGFTIPDSGDDDEWIHNETITAVADLGNTGITFNHDTSGTGTEFPRACRIAGLTSTTNLQVYCSRGNQASDCRYETVEFPPNGPPATPALFAPGDSYVSSDQTPPLTSSSTDADGDDLVYHIQGDNDYDFSSPALDDTSDSPTQGTFTDSQDPGDTSPFVQGHDIVYVPDSPGADGTTYYWRVRTRDPAGSDTWSGWSDVRSVTVDTSATVPTWRQNRAEQWNNSDNPATFVYTRTNASDQVELITPQSGTVYGLTSDGTIRNATQVRTSRNSDYVGRNASNWFRGYLAFDLSGVGDIDSATITVEVNTDSLAAGQNIELHQVDWGPVLDTSDWSLFSGATLVQGDFIAGTDGDDTGPHTSADIASSVTAGAVNYFGLKHNDPDYYGIEMYFADNPGTGSDPRLDWSVGSNSGYVMSAPIPFSDLEIAGSDSWNELTFSMSGGTGGTLKLKLYYDVGGTPTIVPDSDLPGNSSGFDTSPVDISGLSTSTYHTLYIRGEFQTGSDPPNLDEWGITGGTPTAVELVDFCATGGAKTVMVSWETAQEIDNLGFNLYRSTEEDGEYVLLNTELIPGLLSSVRGKPYSYVDGGVTPGVLYYYVLEDVDLDGTRTMHGPVAVDWDADRVADDSTGDSGAGASPSDVGQINPETGIPVSPSDPATQAISSWASANRHGSSKTVNIDGFYAKQHEGGVAIGWNTSEERDNLGFNIYRESNGQVYRITPNLVPGSVFKVGAGTALPGGQSYTFWDALSQRTGRELYWLEYIDVYGQRGYYGPIKPDVYGQWIPERVARRFDAIAQLQRAKTEAFWNAQALRQWLRTRGLKGARGPVSFRTLTPKNSTPPLAGELQWDLAAQAAVKIVITEKGWYRVMQPDLMAAGLDPGVDPRYLQLYVDGIEQPIMVTGSADGRFDPEDTVEFYATGLDTPWTEARVYWLVAGSAPGRRIELWKGRGGREPASSFPYEVEFKERTIYFAALKNGDAENFFGAVVRSTPLDQLLRVHYADPEAPSEALLEVTLQGVTDAPHRVSVLFNDAEAGEVVFAGRTRGVAAVPIPHSWLVEGDNIVTLAAQGGSMDVNLVDSITLTYWRTYVAEGDLLRCTAAGGEGLTIGGFSSPDIRVVDITDPASVQELVATVKEQGSGYSATVRVPGYGIHTLLAFTDRGIKEPALIMDNLPSAWHDTDHGADLIIIAHGDLLADVEPLKQLREQQGLSVAVIDVEDIYDEFSFGAKTPYALRDFLARAYSYWDPQPGFVLVVGDASTDPRNYLGFGDLDLVPTKQVATAYLETASDDWFVDLDGDLLAEMAIGRLPVGSPEECAAVVAKIIGYEEVAGSLGEVLLVADENDEYFNFEAAAYEVAAFIPDQLEVLGIFRGEVGSSLARSQLLATIDQGPLLVNYIGHGSAGIWRGSILTSADAASFTNYPSLPFFVNMTCLNGVFHDVYSEGLGEALLRAQQGGAVAVWASSGLTLPEGQLIMNKELMRLLFNGEGLTIGEAVRGAKQAVSDEDIRKTWNLLGDPTTQLW